MADRTLLATDLYLPQPSAPRSCILIRTPYDKTLVANLIENGTDPVRLAQKGFAVVVQDVRGSNRSQGEFIPFEHEAEDGLATLRWIQQQRWSNGRIGLAGASYDGATQLIPLARHPAGVRAVAPMFTADDYYASWTYQGGALQLGFLAVWTLQALAPARARRLVEHGVLPRSVLDELVAVADQLHRDFPRVAPQRMPIPRREHTAPFYDKWLREEAPSAYWKRFEIPTESIPSVAGLHVGGWYDIFLRGTLRNYARFGQTAGFNHAAQHLVVGPWSHGALSGVYPERYFGLRAHAATEGLFEHQLRFFNRYLEGRSDEIAPARVFLMGRDQWLDEDGWPPRGAKGVEWYLRREGSDTTDGHGHLSREPPDGEEAVDHYVFDPDQPVPTQGGATVLPGHYVPRNAGPKEQRDAAARDDVLVYTSAPLSEPLVMMGPLSVRLFASSDAPDTDFTAKVIDVSPDGHDMNVADGIVRMRHVGTSATPGPGQGETLPLVIDLGDIAYLLAAGHRLRLEISSSNFPRFDVNPNTGDPLATPPSRSRVARQTIFHDAGRASSLSVHTATA